MKTKKIVSSVVVSVIILALIAGITSLFVTKQGKEAWATWYNARAWEQEVTPQLQQKVEAECLYRKSLYDEQKNIYLASKDDQLQWKTTFEAKMNANRYANSYNLYYNFNKYVWDNTNIPDGLCDRLENIE